MIRFELGVYVHVFRGELADVLHHASMWALLAGVRVDVNAIDDKGHGVTTLHGFSLAVDLDTAGDRPVDLSALHGYLARVLPPQYDVVLEATHVHVEWDARRKPAPMPPPTTAVQT